MYLAAPPATEYIHLKQQQKNFVLCLTDRSVLMCELKRRQNQTVHPQARHYLSLNKYIMHPKRNNLQQKFDMKPKIKSLFFVILMFLTYWLGLTFFVVLPFLLGYSFTLCNHVGRLVFLIPFLYILFKKTNINIVSSETAYKSSGFPWLRLLCIGIALAIMALVYYNLFNPNPSVQEKTNETVVEMIVGVISLILLSPITEELLFRKWMISYLERANIKPVYILAITSFLFFIPHTNFLAGYFRFDILLFGAVEYCIYRKYRDVRYCMFVHCINNLIITSINMASQYM